MELNQQLTRDDFKNLKAGDVIQRWTVAHSRTKSEPYVSDENLRVLFNNPELRYLVVDEITGRTRDISYSDTDIYGMEPNGVKTRGSESFEVYFLDHFRLIHIAQDGELLPEYRTLPGGELIPEDPNAMKVKVTLQKPHKINKKDEFLTGFRYATVVLVGVILAIIIAFLIVGLLEMLPPMSQ